MLTITAIKLTQEPWVLITVFSSIGLVSQGITIERFQFPVLFKVKDLAKAAGLAQATRQFQAQTMPSRCFRNYEKGFTQN
jgi:hypothetical protein